MVIDRYSLIQRGLFPETLPPCFTSEDLRRAYRGKTPDMRARALQQKRSTDYIRYNGTKHDGSRRYFGTPNPISYFYVADFIDTHWSNFTQGFGRSPFSVSLPRVAASTDDRSIIIPSLSELTTEASRKIGYSAYVLKTDIAQFFPSIYTHSIPWSAHGIAAAKADKSRTSNSVPFNQLDFFVQTCQREETRGLMVGPDAFRLVAEFIASGLDLELHEAVGQHIVGAARHVDDYYIGLRGEGDALVVLSALREILQRYNLNINDAKTKVLSGLDPLNEVWAQDLRKQSRELRGYWGDKIEDVLLFLNRALAISMEQRSDSAVKIALRTLDQIHAYRKESWIVIEPYLQRIMHHHAHSIDYVALLVAKRVAIGQPIDSDGWKDAAYDLLRRHLAFNHHHEIVWLLWLLVCCGIEVSEQLSDELCRNRNSHILALVLGAFADGRIRKKPAIRLGGKLQSTDDQWLTNLVARSTGYTKAAFSGALADEFSHLASKSVKLIDIQAHIEAVKPANKNAISRTRYGYDSDDDDDDDGWNGNVGWMDARD